MNASLSFFVILLVAAIFSSLVRRFHVPWVVALLLGGMVIGPYGLDIVAPDATLLFLSDMGLAFVMFLAGLSVRLSVLWENWKRVSIIALANGAIPFAVAVIIATFVGYTDMAALLLGIIFISSSIAIVVPTLQSAGMMDTKLGNIIIGVTVLGDIVSLIALSLLLQFVDRTAQIPLPMFYAVLGVLLVLTRWIVPRIRRLVDWSAHVHEKVFEQDVRIVVVVLVGIVLFFEFMGLHAIIAGFFAGFVVSEGLRGTILLEKIAAIGYGIFIPVFFVLVGAQTDLSVFFQAGAVWWAAILVITGSIASKFLSGMIAAHATGFSLAQASYVGALTIPQMSTSLAAAVVGMRLNIISEELMTIIVMLTIITTFVTPFAGKLASMRMHQSRVTST